jgi:hypothetical protein
MNPRIILQALGAAALVGSGCGGATSPGGPPGASNDAAGQAQPDLVTLAVADLAELPDLATPPDLTPAAAYPPGPYGTKAGSVIAPLQWIGYADEAADAVATTKPYVMYAMADLHKSGRAYGLLHISEVY